MKFDRAKSLEMDKIEEYERGKKEIYAMDIPQSEKIERIKKLIREIGL